MRWMAAAATAAGGIVVGTATMAAAGGPREEILTPAPNIKELIVRAIPRADAVNAKPVPRWVVFEWPNAVRPEFRPGAVERGDADEPEIARMEAESTAGVEVNVTVSSREVAAPGPMRLSVEVRNGSSSECGFPTMGSNPYLVARVRVFDDRGKLLPATRFYQVDGRVMNERGGGLSLFGSRRLAPGQSFRVDLVPNLLFDMTLPGDYWVLVEYPFHRRIAAEGRWQPGLARSRPIKLKVHPNPTQFGTVVQCDAIRLPGVDWDLANAIPEADVIIAGELVSTGSSAFRIEARRVDYPEVAVETFRVLKGTPNDLRIKAVSYTVNTGQFESAPREGEDYLFLLRRTERGYQGIKILRKTRENQDAIRAAIAMP